MYKSEWRQVFILAAEIYVFGAFIYLILASGEKQWWANGISNNNSEETEELLDEKKELQRKFNEEELVTGTGEKRKVHDIKRDSGMSVHVQNPGTKRDGTISIQHPSFM